jgi:glycosyltransferase involved in cell wall biosynthesis
LRDVDAIKKIIATFGELCNRRVEFHIVAFDWCLKHYEGMRNVHLYSAIPDDRLLAMYQQAHLLLLPLNDCTANNAVLESMACGLPIFSTEVGSIRDYVDDRCARLAPLHDAEGLVDALIQVDDDRDLLRGMSLAARAKADQFAWPRVAERMMGFYRQIQ